MSRRTVLVAGLALAIVACGVLYLPPTRQALRQLPATRDVLAFARNVRESYDPSHLGHGRGRRDIRLISPGGLAEDDDGNIYVADRAGVIWRIDDTGQSEIIAGSGKMGTAEPGMAAVQARLGMPEGIAIGPTGLVHFADSFNHVVMRIEPDGTLSRVAGVGVPGFGGDGGPADEARLDQPYQVRFDGDGNLYIVDSGNSRIRIVDTGGRIRTIVGPEQVASPDSGTRAVKEALSKPFGAYFDRTGGRLLIADSGNHLVREVARDGSTVILAGTGSPGYSGDGGPATAARLDSPQDLATDREGYVYVNDEHNNAIRVIAPDGRIQTLLGGGRAGVWRDIVTERVRLDNPEAILVRRDGTFLVADNLNRKIRILDADGKVELFAGAAPLKTASSRPAEREE